MQVLKVMPTFVSEFFIGIADTKTPLTKLNYAYDLKVFFSYIITEEEFNNLSLTTFSIEDLKNISSTHIEKFLHYTTFYEKTIVTPNNNHITLNRKNKEKGKSRKLTSVRVLYDYFLKKGKVKVNPAKIVDMPKPREKVITFLEVDETARLLDNVEDGAGLNSEHQKSYHNYTKNRDLAIVTLLLGTGIRISECIGINLNHINFDTNTIKVIRKGGNEAIIYFGSEVERTLKDYIRDREKSLPKKGHENALFLSMQNRRITARAIQNMVKKYASAVSVKNISPHKLRSTFGTHLYRETDDIYLVATMLGHKDVNTTKKHYANMDEERIRKAANTVKLRDN